jgi:hypothetical protein
MPKKMVNIATPKMVEMYQSCIGRLIRRLQKRLAQKAKVLSLPKGRRILVSHMRREKLVWFWRGLGRNLTGNREGAPTLWCAAICNASRCGYTTSIRIGEVTGFP